MTDALDRLRELAPEDATYVLPPGRAGRVIGVGTEGSTLVEVTAAYPAPGGELRVSTGYRDLFAGWPADTEPDPWEAEAADRLRLHALSQSDLDPRALHEALARAAEQPVSFDDHQIEVAGAPRSARLGIADDFAVLVARSDVHYVFVVGPASAVSNLARLDQHRVAELTG